MLTFALHATFGKEAVDFCVDEDLWKETKEEATSLIAAVGANAAMIL